MKKQLLVLALISANYVSPEWREHRGFLGGVLNTSEAIVEAPAEIVSPSYREDARIRNDEREIRREERRYRNGYDRNGYDRNGRYNSRYDQRSNRSYYRD